MAANTARICDVPGGEDVGLFFPPVGDGTKPNILMGVIFGVLLVYCFLGVAIVSDIFMNSIETVTSWKRKVIDKETGRSMTVHIWNETVATLTLMALGSSAPEIFLAVIENFKKGFHSGDLGPSTIVGSASFNLFVIIAVCCCVIPSKEVRRIDNMKAFLVTAVFSVGAYMWMVFALVLHGKDVIDLMEAILTLLYLPLLVWVSYSVDVGLLSRFTCSGKDDSEDSEKPAQQCHHIGFQSMDVNVVGLQEPQELDIPILRKGGLRTATQCTYRTERLWGVPSYDFEDVAGTIEFDEDETEVVLKLTIPAKSPKAIGRNFLLILENSEGTCDFDPDGDGGAECAMLTINVSAIDTSRSARKSIEYLINENSIRYAFGEWAQQFVSALYCNGSPEDQAEASIQDWFYHFVTLPWKLGGSFIPPTSFFGGWLSFGVAIGGIALVTAVISDVAEMFGCLLDVPDVVTATTFVALGTSMPDLFASLSAAVDDPTADASIVNVTGSNSVNVFLGLGIPWTCSALYWGYMAERTEDWEERYPQVSGRYPTGTVFAVESRNLGFSVLVFSVLCGVAVVVILMRRKCLGAELGGPSVPKFASGFLLVWLWVVFVSLTSWRVLRFEIASSTEEGIVCGGMAIITFIFSVPALLSTYMYGEQARTAAKLSLQKISSTPVSDTPLPPGLVIEADPQKLRNTAEKENDVSFASNGTSGAPALQDLFDVSFASHGSCGGRPFNSEMKFMKLSAGRQHMPEFGSHKVSMLPSRHAKIKVTVSVIVVAYHNSGRNETTFQTSMSKPLRHVMHAWCKRNNFDDSVALFSFNHKHVDPASTVGSLGHDPSKGPLVLRARPIKQVAVAPNAKDAKDAVDTAHIIHGALNV